MRIQDITRSFVALAHGFANLLVAIGSTANQRANLLVTLIVQVVDTGKVRRIAYVHRISQSLLRWFRLVFASLQILVEDIVGIVGCDESLDGQSHLMAEQRCTDISEVS